MINTYRYSNLRHRFKSGSQIKDYFMTRVINKWYLCDELSEASFESDYLCTSALLYLCPREDMLRLADVVDERTQ